MEFGKVEPAELEKTDFSLPPDHPANEKILGKSKREGRPKVYIGCAKWGRKDWIGKLYPPGTPEKDFLHHYARLFNSIELNSVFYGLPAESTFLKWKETVPPGFKFCPKFTNSITHLKRLRNTQREVELFLYMMNLLGDHLGPIFLMPHPQLTPKSIEVLQQFLDELPAGTDVFVEMRHPEWYQPPFNHELESLLEEKKLGYVITDTAGRRDMLHMRLTVPRAFIRFVGNSLHPSDYARVDDWVDRLEKWIHMGLQELYFFMHQHNELHSPELITYLINKLNERCDLGLKAPALLNKQHTLV